GLGDVKLEAAIGALLGYPVALAAIFAGVLAGGVAGAVLLLTKRAGRKDPIAYGPYLALGAWLVYTRALGLWPG
ncbi:MAG: prepilin peptidase, partial [Anaerolineae bacterium]